MPPVRFRYQTVEFDDTDIHVKTLRDKQLFADDDGAAARLGISSATYSLYGVIRPSGIFDSPNISFQFIRDGGIKFEIEATLGGNQISGAHIGKCGASLQPGNKPEIGTFPNDRD